MDLEARITFPGGVRVDAELEGRRIQTDQPASAGGTGSAPEPFALFAASLGTCAGFYVLRFCQARELPTQGLAIRQRLRFDEGRLTEVQLDVELPEGFPEKYREALVRAAEGCKVKKAIEAQPRFVVRSIPAERAA